jgi:hypothetical protein
VLCKSPGVVYPIDQNMCASFACPQFWKESGRTLYMNLPNKPNYEVLLFFTIILEIHTRRILEINEFQGQLYDKQS